MTDPTNPLIVQGDLSVLAEVASPRFEEARSQLARFAELEKAPEHIHTYRITPLSLWNAAVAGAEFGAMWPPRSPTWRSIRWHRRCWPRCTIR
jgi:hypothetical protein